MWAPRYWKLVQSGIFWATRQPWCRDVLAAGDDRYGDLDSDWDNTIPLHSSEIPVGSHHNLRVPRLLMESRTAEEGALNLLRAAIRDVTARPISLPETRSLHPRVSRIQRIQKPLARYWQNVKNIWRDLLLTTFLFLLCASGFVACAAAATAVVHLELDNVALFNSPNCGVWRHNSSGSQVATWWGWAEERVIQYYRECYESEPSLQQCNLFSHRELHATVTENDECPFRGDVCLLGKNSAITLDTGYMDSKYLGINSSWRPVVRKRNICAPVVTKGYVKIEDIGGVFTQSSFYYGPTKYENWTYTRIRQVGYDIITDPTYSVTALSSRLV